MTTPRAVPGHSGGVPAPGPSTRQAARQAARWSARRSGPAGGGVRHTLGASLRVAALRWGTFATAVAVWELATRSMNDSDFPPPSQIARSLHDLYLTGPASHLFLNSEVGADIVPSLVRMLTGWLLAVVIGVAAGVALGRSERAMDYLGPVVHFLRAIPPPALLPVFLVLLTAGDSLQIGIIVFGAVWTVLLNSVEGARSVHRTQRETAEVFQVTRTRWITRVVLPAAAPKIFAGLRLSLSLALVLMVVAEYTSSSNGIGYQMQNIQGLFDTPGSWAILVLLGIFGYVFNAILMAAERRVLRWQVGRGSGL